MKQHKTTLKRSIAILMTLAMVLSLPTGITTSRQAQAADYGLNNPTTDSNGVTTWDCVYFGNYWQNDTNGDGVADENDAKQPIKWRVLSVDGDDAFLLADQNLDAGPYNKSYTDVTWETCTMRSWLNGYGASSNVDSIDYSSDNFIDAAFTSAEKNVIRQVTVVNEDNPYYGTEGGMIRMTGCFYCLSQRQVMRHMDLIVHLIRIVRLEWQQILHMLPGKAGCLVSVKPTFGGCGRRAALVGMLHVSLTMATATATITVSTMLVSLYAPLCI